MGEFRPMRYWLFFVCAALGAQPDPVASGSKAVSEAVARLSSALAVAVAKDGPAGALPACGEQAPIIAREVSAAHGVMLRRVSHRARNPGNQADTRELNILSAFREDIAAGKPLKHSLQVEEGGALTLYAPIVIGNPLCLRCHGEPGKEVDDATLAAIAKRYPDDRATGFHLGEIRGLWKVVLPPAKK